MQTTVYLVRHSEKMHMPRWQDRTFLDRIQPLNVNGERKAKGLLQCEEIRSADAVRCSPFARTLSTLRYVVEADHLPVTMDEDLKELEFGIMPGTDGPPDPSEKPPMGPKGGPKPGGFRGRQWEDRDLAAEQGESLNQAAERMHRAVLRFVQENPGKKLLIGSHGAAICAYLSRWLPEINDAYTGQLPQPSVFRMVFDGDQVTEVCRLVLPAEACDPASIEE